MTLRIGQAFINQENQQIIITSLSNKCVEFIKEVRKGYYTKDITRQETFIEHCNCDYLRPLFRTREEHPTFTTYEPKTIIINL